MNDQISKVLIIVAMQKELEYFLTLSKEIANIKIHHLDVFICEYNNKTIILGKVGIGKVNAAVGTTLLINHFHPDLVINSGIAGAYQQNLQPLDIIIGQKIFYADVDMTSDQTTNLQYGQLEGLPICFKCDLSIIDNIQFSHHQKIIIGNIASGDQFRTNFQSVKTLVEQHFTNKNIQAFDMESASIAHVCYLFNIPIIIGRVISDLIGSTNEFEYQSFSIKASHLSGQLIEQLLNKI